MRHILLRITPRLDRRWLLALGVAGLLLAAATFVRWGSPLPELELVVLGPDGHFHDTLVMPADWADTATVTTDAVARFPLILGVLNAGHEAARPGRLVLSVPARYRLTDATGRELQGRIDPASPLIAYTLDPQLEPVVPGALPALLPGHETLWLEAVVPRYYCVDLADGIPEFVPAPPPPVRAMSDIRLFYVLDGGDMTARGTGTVRIQVDPALLEVPMPEQPPSFPMEVDRELAQPQLGVLQYVATQEVRCGEPEAPMELVSILWEGEGGARVISLEVDGVVRKQLFDLNGDGVIDRESWDPEGRGVFTATRRSMLPIPDFLLPAAPGVAYDMARFHELPPDSLARLNPFRRAMQGPGPLPLTPPERRDPGLGPRPAATPADPVPPPVPRPAQPLGRPLPGGPQPEDAD
jgi:hypothetical protein